MKQYTAKYVKSLVGPPSAYCNCKVLCSPPTADHVLPKSFIKTHISNTQWLKLAYNDPHNIYRVCKKMNFQKGSSILQREQIYDPFSGIQARSYLYMNLVYSLQFDEYLTEVLKSMNTYHAPKPFEIRRSCKITNFIGHENPFVTQHPRTKFQ